MARQPRPRPRRSVLDFSAVLATEADGWDPSTVSYGSATKMPWVCSLGHRWLASPNQRTHGDSAGCPYCTNRLAWPGYNDIATLRPDLAAEADGWDPATLVPGSHEKRAWRCTQGHTWTAQVKSRASGVGCPYCANQRVLAGFNDLATTHPELAAQADGWDPTTVIAGSGKKVDWVCEQGHRWRADMNSRVAGNGCPVCANRQVLTGHNDLATLFPQIAAEADGWDPSATLAGSHRKMAWVCALGHRWETTVLHRTSRNQGCPYCANRRVLAGFNDLATHFPQLAAEADGWDPATEIVDSHHIRSWRCAEGHRWRAEIKSRCDGRGCATCAKYGYDPKKPAWLYLLRHDRWGMLQIGITNSPESRMAAHRTLGWRLLEMHGPMDGQRARDLEQATLKELRSRGVTLGDTRIAGRFSGYTEAWIEKEHPVAGLDDLLDTHQVVFDEGTATHG